MRFVLLVLAHCLCLCSASTVDSVGSPCAGAAALVNFGAEKLSTGVGNYKHLCHNDAFLSTAGHCIVAYSKADVTIRKQGFRFLSELCRIKAGRHISPTELSQLTDTTILACNWTLDDTALHSQPVALPQEVVDHNVHIRHLQNAFTSLTHRLGLGVILYFASVLTLVSIIHLIPTNKMPTWRPFLYIQRYIFMAPTFSYHHSLTYGPFQYSVPTRAVSLFIVSFVALNIIFLSLGYHFTTPNYAFPTASLQITVQLAERAGYLAVCHIPVLILFAGRNNWLLWTTGLPLDTYLVIHRWIARTMVSELVIHSLCYTLCKLQLHSLKKSWHARFWIFGFCAVACGGMILLQSFLVLRRRSYETFLWIHITLAVLFVSFAWQHLHRVDEGREYLYVAVSFWALDRILRLCRSLYISQTSWRRLGVSARVTLHPGEIIQITLKNSRAKPYPGSFGFLTDIKAPWESHPFSLIQGPCDVHIFARVRNGMTQRLCKTLRNEPNYRLDTSMFLEGVYGQQLPLENYRHIVLICGGIGITGVWAYAQYLFEKCPQVHARLVWYIADSSSLDWFGPHLAALEPRLMSGVTVYVKSLGSHTSKLNLKHITITIVTPDVRQVIAQETTFYSHHKSGGCGRMAVLCCGPGSMNDDARSAVVSNKTACPVDYYEESFSW